MKANPDENIRELERRASTGGDYDVLKYFSALERIDGLAGKFDKELQDEIYRVFSKKSRVTKGHVAQVIQNALGYKVTGEAPNFYWTSQVIGNNGQTLSFFLGNPSTQTGSTGEYMLTSKSSKIFNNFYIGFPPHSWFRVNFWDPFIYFNNEHDETMLSDFESGLEEIQVEALSKFIISYEPKISVKLQILDRWLVLRQSGLFQ